MLVVAFPRSNLQHVVHLLLQDLQTPHCLLRAHLRERPVIRRERHLLIVWVAGENVIHPVRLTPSRTTDKWVVQFPHLFYTTPPTNDLAPAELILSKVTMGLLSHCAA